MMVESFGKLISQHSSEAKYLVRKIETLARKVNSCELAAIFNHTCIKENLLPKYTNLRIHDRAVQQKEFTYQFRRNLVEEQYRQKSELKVTLNEELVGLRRKYKEMRMDSDLKRKTETTLNKIIATDRQQCETRIIRKLSHLYGDPWPFLNIPIVSPTSQVQS